MMRARTYQARDARIESTQPLPSVPADADGWSAYARLIGSRHDVLAVHLRPTLDEIGDVGRQTRCWAERPRTALDYSFLSVTEAGLYHLTAQLAREAAQRGAGRWATTTYVAELGRACVAGA